MVVKHIKQGLVYAATEQQLSRGHLTEDLSYDKSQPQEDPGREGKQMMRSKPEELGLLRGKKSLWLEHGDQGEIEWRKQGELKSLVCNRCTVLYANILMSSFLGPSFVSFCFVAFVLSLTLLCHCFLISSVRYFAAFQASLDPFWNKKQHNKV